MKVIKLGIKMIVTKIIIVSHINHKPEKLFIKVRQVKINGKFIIRQKYQYAEKDDFNQFLSFKYFVKIKGKNKEAQIILKLRSSCG